MINRIITLIQQSSNCLNLLVVLLFLTQQIHAQSILNNGTNTTNLLTINAPSSGYVYRSHWYTNTTNLDFNGTVDLDYDVTSPYSIPNQIGIRTLTVVLTNTNVDIRPSTYSPSANPFATGGWVKTFIPATPSPICGSTAMGTLTEIIGSVSSTAGTFGLASDIDLLLSNVCIPSGASVYIIEKIQVNTCLPDGGGFTTRLLVDFTDTPTGTLSSFQPGGALSVQNEIPIFTLNQTAGTSLPEFANTFFDNNCTAQEIERELVYTLNGGALKDPTFNFRLNNDSLDQISLIEATLDDVEVRFELDMTDDNIWNPITTNYVTLTDLRTALTNANLNAVYTPVDATGNEDYFDPTGTTINYDPTALGLIKEEYWDQNSYPTWATNGLRSSSAIYTTPSMKPGGGEVLLKFNLNLSNMVIPAVGGIGPNQLNTHTPFSAYDPLVGTQTDRDLVYVKIQPGSKIYIKYKGVAVAQDEIPQPYERFRERKVNLSHQIFSAIGYTECGNGQGFLREMNPVGGTESANQTNIFGIPNSMSGNPDHLNTTWDGDIQEFTAEMKDFIYASNKAKAFNFDYACSRLELQLDLGQGLTVPCPCELSSNITFPTTPIPSGDNTICDNYGANTQYVGGAATIFGGGVNPSFVGDCQSVYSIPNQINPGDLFWIELNDGSILVPQDLHIVPEYDPTNGSMISQRWSVSFELGDFYTYNSVTTVSGISNAKNSLMDGATIHFWAKAFCPAEEGTTEYTLTSYLRMGICSNPSTINYAAGSTTGGIATCGATCSPICPFGKVFIGSRREDVTITCPGCRTPGGLLYPLDIVNERHPDYMGLADTDNDGLPDSFSNPAIANATSDPEVDRSFVRHGDVFTAEVLASFFDGSTLNIATGESYNVGDLATASSISITGTTPPLPVFPACSGLSDLELKTYVYEINADQFGSYFVPLINGTSANSIAHLTGEFDADDVTEYLSLANQYPSEIKIEIPGGASNWIPIDPTDIVWKDNSTLRFAFDLQKIGSLYTNNTAANSPAFNYQLLSNDITLRFRFQFLTDVDVSPNTWSAPEQEDGRRITFDHLFFGTDQDAASWLTPDNSGNYKIIAGDGNETTLCDIQSDIAWWCEKREGAVTVAPYVENRLMVAHNLNASTNTKYYEEFVDDLNLLSPGSEMTHQFFSIVGNAKGNTNVFKNEIRYPAEIEFVELSIPEPYLPEGIILWNSSVLAHPDYSADNKNYLTYVLHLQDQNGVLHPTIDASGNPTGVVYPYGITVEQGVKMPTHLYPKYPAGYTGPGPLNGTLSSYDGEPIFDNSTASQVPHWRIRIPLEVYENPAAFQTVHANASGPTSPTNPDKSYFNMYIDPITHPASSWSSTATIPTGYPGDPRNENFPYLVVDETAIIAAAVIYNQPTCEAPSWTASGAAAVDDPAEYIENQEFYAERNSFWYYHGNDDNVLSIFRKWRSAQVVATNAMNQYAVAPSDFSSGLEDFIHPPFETPLMMPSRIKTSRLKASNLSTPHGEINSNKFGVNSHPLFNPAFEAEFSGAIPAFYDNPATASHYTGYSPYTRSPNILFDQRSNLGIQPGPTTDIQVDPTNGEFTFSFQLKDSTLLRLATYAAPWQVDLLQMDDVADWITNNGLSLPIGQSGNMTGRLAAFKGVSDGDGTKGYPQIDLSNFYFYLKPQQSSPTLNYLNHLRIKDISWNHPGNGGTSVFTGVSPNGILAGDGTGVNSQPRLFYIDDVVPAHQIWNGQTKTVTVTCEFDCGDSEILNDLSTTGSNFELPFDIVVNYNCERNVEPWKGWNAAAFLQGNTASSGRGELTYEIAQRTRCSNDMILKNYTLEPAQLGFSVSLDEITSGGNASCDRTFVLRVENLANGEITPKRVVLTSPLIHPTGWTLVNGSTDQYEYEFPQGLLPLGVNASEQINVVFPNAGCSDLNLSGLTGYVDSYCSSCVGCELEETGTITQNNNPDAITIGLLSKQDETCMNTCDGAIAVTASGGCGSLSYLWKQGQTVLSSTSPIINGLCAGTYEVTVSAGAYCQSSQSFTIVTNNSGTTTQSVALCEGSSLQIGTPNSGNTWTITNNATNAIALGSSGMITGLSAGSATVLYTENGGCNVAYNVTVTGLPTAGTINLQPQTICVGQTSQATTNGTQGGIWSIAPAGTNVATIDAVSGFIQGTNPGVATVIYSVTNNCGTTTSSIDFAVVGLNDAGVLSASPSEICSGEQTQISTTGTTGGVWTITQTSDPSISGTISNSGGLTAQNTGTVQGTITVEYTVSNPTSPCPPASSTIDIIVTPKITPTFSSLPSVCLGQVPVLPTESDESISGTWSIQSATQSQLFYAFIPDAGECAVTAFFAIDINPAPPIGYQVVKPSCECDGQIFSTLPYPIQMNVAVLTGNGSTSSYQPLPNGNNLCSGTYELTFTNSITGCSATTVVDLTSASNGQNPSYLPLLAPGTPYTPQSGNPLWITGNLHVPSGSQLTLTSEHVIIDHNATVQIDGTLLLRGTKIEFRNPSHTMDIGSTGSVTAEESGLTPSVLTSGNCERIWGGVRNDGVFELKKSIIEHALIAVKSSGSGPQIIANESIFRNNYQGIHISNDQEMHLHAIKNQFLVDQNTGLLPLPGASGSPIQFRSNHHIFIQQSRFNGNNTPTTPPFSTIQRNQFSNAEVGIEIRDFSRDIAVNNNNVFEENTTGIFVDNLTQGIVIDENRFKTADPNEIGIHFNLRSHGQINNNQFNAASAPFASNYLGIQVANNSTISSCVSNSFRSFKDNRDTGIFATSNSNLNANNNLFSSFDQGILGNDRAFVYLTNNRINVSYIGIALDDVRQATVQDNRIQNLAVVGQAANGTVGIMLANNVIMGTATIRNNLIKAAHWGIHILNDGDAIVENNTIQDANIGIWLDNAGPNHINFNTIETANDFGILAESMTQANAVHIFQNTLSEMANGIQLQNAWFSTISSNEINAVSTNGNNFSGNGIALINSNFHFSPSLSNSAVGANKIERFYNGIFSKISEFHDMDKNEISFCSNGIQIIHNDFATTPLLRENLLKENRTGLSCSRSPSNPNLPSGFTIKLKMQCNEFVGSIQQAKFFQVGRWEILNENNGSPVFSAYFNLNGFNSNFRKVTVGSSSGVIYRYPPMNNFPIFGSPFYEPTISGLGTPVPIPFMGNYALPCNPSYNSGGLTPSNKNRSNETSTDFIEILVFPNPTSGVFEIISQRVNIDSVSVMNSMGQVVLTRENKKDWNFDLSSFESGVYQLRITCDDGQVITKKVVYAK